MYQVDAFTRQSFGGNPAAVVVLPTFAAAAELQAVAAENNLSETAFVVADETGFSIRWFTPTVEVPLCGHATLASAAVVMERLRPDLDRVTFASASGPLPVGRVEDGYLMDLPARRCTPIEVPGGLADALGVRPVETMADGSNVLVRVERAADVRTLRPDLAAIGRIEAAGVIVTAAGDDGYDCVSRYFAPAKGIPEDPVTGGAHCALTPFWAERLGKVELLAFQASARGGEIRCRLDGNRVRLTGSCVFFLDGEIEWQPSYVL
jgi:PhzF family phenazine biosynthesis protein